jgi:hypothetical protein
MSNYYLLLFLQPRKTRTSEFSQWRREIFSMLPEITPHMYLDAVDDPDTGPNKYRHVNVYRLTESTSPPADSQIETQILYLHSGNYYLSAFHWHIYSSIAETRLTELLSAHTVVTVGITIPTTDAAELDRWYAQEHMPALATVRGWQAGTRLQLLTASSSSPPEKDVEYAAPYLAMHEWAERNELGGETWKEAVFTPWSERIMTELQSAPVHRRVWARV